MGIVPSFEEGLVGFVVGFFLMVLGALGSFEGVLVLFGNWLFGVCFRLFGFLFGVVGFLGVCNW